MVVTKARSLTTFYVEKNDLLAHLALKEAGSLVTDLNKNFKKDKYQPEGAHVASLLHAIETKFKRCETLYYLYFENIDHAILTRSTSSTVVELLCEIEDGTAITNYQYKLDDPQTYKDLIDQNFQSFILCLSSLYENLIILAEIFVKKVVLYLSQPLSITLLDYFGFHKILVDLGYRGHDDLATCLTSFRPFFEEYAEHIRQLRNRFIHGFSACTETDGSAYFIDRLETKVFTPKVPQLQLDIFTKHVLDMTRPFIRDLMVAIKNMGSASTAQIPS